MTVLRLIEETYLNNAKNDKPYLDEKEWKNIAKNFQLSKKDFLFQALDFAKSFSLSNISQYKVGAVGIGCSNKLYLGTNIEFPSFPLNLTIHAEQSLMSMAYAQQEVGLKEIYLTAFPCGHCRQFFREMANYKKFKINVASQKNKTFLLPQLLPHSFGPQDLNITSALFLNSSEALVEKLLNIPPAMSNELKQKLLTSIKNSFAPYSQNPSGVVFVFEDCEPIVGSYIESCAYNPSLSPFHMAYAQSIMLKRDMTKLRQIYLVEMKEADKVQQNFIPQMVEKFMPKAQFFILRAV